MPDKRKRQTLTARKGGSQTITSTTEGKSTQKLKTPAKPAKEEGNAKNA